MVNDSFYANVFILLVLSYLRWDVGGSLLAGASVVTVSFGDDKLELTAPYFTLTNTDLPCDLKRILSPAGFTHDGMRV